MQGAERLKLFKADLLAPGAFDEAIAGCDMVIHTASPFQLDVPKGEQRSCSASELQIDSWQRQKPSAMQCTPAQGQTMKAATAGTSVGSTGSEVSCRDGLTGVAGVL
jgi:hypothetical protein